MRKIILIIATALAAMLAHAQQGWTLQQCVDSALVHNWNVKQYNLRSKTSEINYKQAQNDRLPSLNGSGAFNLGFGSIKVSQVDPNNPNTVQYVYVNSTSKQASLGLDAGLTLYSGLRIKHNIEARNADLQASYAEKKLQEDNVKVNVSSAYLQVLLDKELLQVAADQLALTKTKIEQRKSLIDNGKMAEGEMYELESQLAKEELNKTKSENALKLDLLTLAQLIVVKDVDNFDVYVPETFPEETLGLVSANSIYESAVTHRPEIKSAEYRLLSSEKDVLVNKAGAYPTLSLVASSNTYYYNGTNAVNDPFSSQFKNNWNTSVGLSLKIPIFNQFQVKNSVAKAKIAVESSKVDLSTAKEDLKKSIEQAYYNAVAAKSRWEAAQKSEMAAREAYRFSNQKYEAGRASLYDLYQAKSNLTQVLGEKSQAKYEYVFRMKILELLK